MSEPCTFLLIRDGERRFYGSRWAGVFLYRELLWGPEEFAARAEANEQLDEIDQDDETDCFVAVDFDRKRLVWSELSSPLKIPRVNRLYHRLLQAAWPGFEALFAHRQEAPLAALAHDERQPLKETGRPETIDEVSRELIYQTDDEDDDEDDDDKPEFYEGEIRAWVTLVDRRRVVRQLQLEEISLDILLNDESAVKTLFGLSASEVPPEDQVAEGIWIDQSRQKIGLWGGESLRSRLPEMQRCWEGWTINWAQRGYAEQCEVAGRVGKLMTDEEALAKFVPVVLSTRQFNFSGMVQSLGGGLKRTAMKATGCLVVVICLPILIFGLISGDWTSVAVTCGIVVVLAMVAFKIAEYRVSRWLARRTGEVMGNADDMPPVAGPSDEQQRRAQLDSLLQAAGLPPLSAIEPHFSACDDLELLAIE